MLLMEVCYVITIEGISFLPSDYDKMSLAVVAALMSVRNEIMPAITECIRALSTSLIMSGNSSQH